MICDFIDPDWLIADYDLKTLRGPIRNIYIKSIVIYDTK